MLRFGGKSPQQPPRNYLARPEQFRLLVLVASLGLVVLVMTQMRSPAGRQALASLLGETPALAADQQTSEPLRPDQVRQWMTADQRESIRDNTTFRNAESEAWFAVLGQLHHEQSINSLPALRVTYAQLARQPETYRGRTVRVTGQIMRVEPQTPAGNPLLLESYYRVIFRPAGKQVWPIAAYTLKAPDGVALDTTVSTPATVVGVFFKNQSYQSQAGAGIMPIVLARTVTIDTPLASSGAADADPIESSDLWTILGVSAAVAAVVVALIVLRSRG